MRASGLRWIVADMLCVCATICALSLAQESKSAETWAPFQFVLGDWVGRGTGAPGEGEGRFSFKLDLDGKILIRKSRSDYPPKAGETSGISHEDLLIVYPLPESKTYRAIYFDNEGHVIHYTVAFPAGQSSLTFESEGSSREPRFRLAYRKDETGGLVITFSVAPPGQPFKDYLKGTASRRS